MLAATALSEAVSACMMLLFYHREARRCFAGEKARRPRDPARRLWDILWPVEGGRCLASALHTAENMLVPACLTVCLLDAGGRRASGSPHTQNSAPASAEKQPVSRRAWWTVP